jgi:carbon-monoxide dehydrogenase medium subunit
MTRQRAVELSPLVRERHPLLHAAIRNIAHPQNRNQGTVGGSLAHADPAAELPALALALDAEVTVVGPRGARKITAADLFVTYLTTSLEPSEILTEVRWPMLPARSGWSFTELARRHGDFALAGVIAIVTLGKDGRCAQRVSFCSGWAPRRFARAKPSERSPARRSARSISSTVRAWLGQRSRIRSPTFTPLPNTVSRSPRCSRAAL